MTVAEKHIPVLLPEIIHALGDLHDTLVIDATYGRGSYSRAFLKQGAQVIAIDRDPEAVKSAKDLQAEYPNHFSIVEGCFGDLGRLAASHADCANAIVFDLGVSSPQLESETRGFSFRFDAPLDMRMSQQGKTAADLINQLSEAELKQLIKTYGEEKHASRIAKAIVKYRNDKGEITTTKILADVIQEVLPRRHNQKIHPATKTFQALRIAVNDELQQLHEGLTSATGFLTEGGKLAVVSFHSLEDRIVKQLFASLATMQNPSRHAPEQPDKVLHFKHVGKPITPSADEIANNPRCRSATLRVLQKRTS